MSARPASTFATASRSSASAAACIDACNETMRRVDRPLDLIRWDTLARQQSREQGKPLAAWRPVRARTILYAALLAVVGSAMAAAFVLRSDADLSVQRDRSPNFVRLSNGDLRNAYTVKISNKRQQERRFTVELRGLPGATLGYANAAPPFTVHSDAVVAVRVLVTVPAASAPAGSQPVEFVIRDAAGRDAAAHESAFVGPPR
jgi:polyferredoxin